MREKQTQREAAMDKEELVFTTIEDLIRYLGECGEDVQIHMEIEVEGKGGHLMPRKKETARYRLQARKAQRQLCGMC